MISLVSEIAGFGLLILRGFETSTIFFILGVVVVRFMMGRKWLGGGDAQVAVAMIAITRAPEFLLFLAVVTILVWMIISIKHFGFKGWLIRTRFVAKNLGRPVESDNERLRSPWVVTLAMCSLVYIWFVPGLAWM
ncbi:MAG: hypothetical protein FP831_15625 [Anaerolineae bacterium]|nr:hypothetical protein [Anaerolineae bacterium]